MKRMIEASSRDVDCIPGLAENVFLTKMHQDLKASGCFAAGVCRCWNFFAKGICFLLFATRLCTLCFLDVNIFPKTPHHVIASFLAFCDHPIPSVCYFSILCFEVTARFSSNFAGTLISLLPSSERRILFTHYRDTTKLGF